VDGSKLSRSTISIWDICGSRGEGREGEVDGAQYSKKCNQGSYYSTVPQWIFDRY